MNTLDITALARTFGAVGRSWSQFQCSDAVQDFVCAHSGSDIDLDTWRAAFDAGEVEHLTSHGWVSRWTTAPADYDSFGTTTAELCGDWHGKPMRRILCHPYHADYQEARNGSGMHPTWSEDPRVEKRVAAERHSRLARLRAEDETRRAAGLAWMAGASEVEIEDAKERDEIESRGLTYTDLSDELRRRSNARAELERSETWSRCRAAFHDGAILVDDGTPGERGMYGWIPGKPTRVHYNARVEEHWNHPGDAEHATVISDGLDKNKGECFAYVAKWISSGRYHVVTADDVPPEPVVRRIGHDRWREIVRTEIAGRVVWVGRPSFTSEPLVLDERGRIVRAKGAREAGLTAYTAAGSP